MNEYSYKRYELGMNGIEEQIMRNKLKDKYGI